MSKYLLLSCTALLFWVSPTPPQQKYKGCVKFLGRPDEFLCEASHQGELGMTACLRELLDGKAKMCGVAGFPESLHRRGASAEKERETVAAGCKETSAGTFDCAEKSAWLLCNSYQNFGQYVKECRKTPDFYQTYYVRGSYAEHNGVQCTSICAPQNQTCPKVRSDMCKVDEILRATIRDYHKAVSPVDRRIPIWSKFAGCAGIHLTPPDRSRVAQQITVVEYWQSQPERTVIFAQKACYDFYYRPYLF